MAADLSWVDLLVMVVAPLFGFWGVVRLWRLVKRLLWS